MQITSATRPKFGILKTDGRKARGRPRGAAAIEKWIIKLGGHELTPTEKAYFKRFGLLGMPKE